MARGLINPGFVGEVSFSGEGARGPLATWIIAGVFVARFVLMAVQFGKAG